MLIAAGTFTGGINAIAAGATLCVAAGATLQPAYLNRGAGRLLNEGVTTLPAFLTAAGMQAENGGTLNLPNGLTDNGPLALLNKVGGTVTVGTQLALPSGATITNLGTIQVVGPATLNGGSRLDNSGTLNISGTLSDNGTIANTGDLAVGQSFSVNGTGSFGNACQTTSIGFSNNAASTNSGVLTAGPTDNNGTFVQAPTGIAVGTDFTNTGTVNGFGRYSFSGTTASSGQFAGTTVAAPIAFEDTTPTGSQVLDRQAGTITNVSRETVDLAPPTFRPPGCSDAPALSTDLVASSTGPSTVDPGGLVSYTLTVRNLGPADATDVDVRDTLPPALAAVASTPAGTASSGSLMWTVGTISAGQSRTFTVTGTAPAAGTLSNVISAATATPDADPNNNDGRLASARVSTTIQVAPPNNPPVVTDTTVRTDADLAVSGASLTADPDPGQAVSITLATPPAHGTVAVQPDGIFTYRPATDFTGVDTFQVHGCDNATPVLCDAATVTVTVLPVAVDDHAETTIGTAVVIPIRANDIGITDPATLPAAPGDGTFAGSTYTPARGFAGTDTVEYQVCAPDAPNSCAKARVTVDVLAPTQRPTVGDDTRMTTVDVAVDGTVALTNPAGRALQLFVGTPPGQGTIVLAPDGGYAYTPMSGYAGADAFTVIGCDPTNRLCATGQVSITVLSTTLGPPSPPTDPVVTVATLPSTSGLSLIWPMLAGVLVAAGVFLVALAHRRRTT